MSNREADILQIRKYLNGELDARAMHKLERRALDDPFLMDALDGFGEAANNQQAQLNDLANRLKQRIAPKERRIIPMRILAIAASVLIVCSVGIWWFNNNQPLEKSKVVANLELSAPAAKAPAVVKDKKDTVQTIPAIAVTRQAQKRQAQTQTVASVKSPEDILKSLPSADKMATIGARDSLKTDTTPINEMIATQYSAPKKKDKDNPANVLAKARLSRPKTPTEQLLQGHVDGVTIAQNEGKPPEGTFYPKLVPQRIIKGQVIAGDDKLPIPGASVKIAGTNIGAVTDVDGKFSLPANSNKTKLVVGSVGYATQQVNTGKHDSVKTIALKPSSNSLSEVAITQNADEYVIPNAHPKDGWSAFKKYLKEKAISPDGQNGIVKILFDVDADGNIMNIKIKKGLSPATDQLAIELINEGPAWVGNVSGETENVSMRIKFGK